jgi:hypothetical protein
LRAVEPLHAKLKAVVLALREPVASQVPAIGMARFQPSEQRGTLAPPAAGVMKISYSYSSSCRGQSVPSALPHSADGGFAGSKSQPRGGA